jgi:hypothetical protein
VKALHALPTFSTTGVLVAALVALIPACAHTGEPARDTLFPATHSSDTIMQTNTTTTAEEIAQRMLKLIDSIHGPQQIDAGHIEQVTGFKVASNPNNPHQYGFSGKLSEDWAYSLVSLTETSGGKPSRLMFSFEDRSEDENADMAPVCALDFQGYSKALTDAGFQPIPARGHHNEIEYWDFNRDQVRVQVYTRGESDAKADHACVSMLIINA